MPGDFTLRPMTVDDWPAVRDIYLEGIATGNATFATSAPDWQAWDAGHRRDCRMVTASPECEILGWAALSEYSSRCVYAGVADESVYVREAARRRRFVR